MSCQSYHSSVSRWHSKSHLGLTQHLSTSRLTGKSWRQVSCSVAKNVQWTLRGGDRLSSVNTRQNSEHYSLGKYHPPENSMGRRELQELRHSVSCQRWRYVRILLLNSTTAMWEYFYNPPHQEMQLMTHACYHHQSSFQLVSIVQSTSSARLGKTEYSMIGMYACHTQFTWAWDSKEVAIRKYPI
jgi:hypothetical protein